MEDSTRRSNRHTTVSTPGSSNNTEITPADIQRWIRLFRYDEHDALFAIATHRNDPSAHISDEQWRWVQWGHEKAGFNKEAYEHLLRLKDLRKKDKSCKERGLQLCEWVGDYSRICLEGYLSLNTLQRILNDQDIGTVDSTEKWCYIKHNQSHEQKIFFWVKRWDEAVCAGIKAYNEIWKAAVEEQKVATTLARAGFQPVSPSISHYGNITDIRVGYFKITEDRSSSYLASHDVPQLQNGNDSPHHHQPQVPHLQAEHNRVQPLQPLQVPPLQQEVLSIDSVLPMTRVGSVQHFLQNYRAYPGIRLPEFGNAPRVFPLAGEAVFLQRGMYAAALRNSPGATNTVPISPLDAPQQFGLQVFTTRSSRRAAERLLESYQTKRRLIVLRERADRPKTPAHRMEQLFGPTPPATVSDMTIREITVACSLMADEATNELNSASDAITTPGSSELSGCSGSSESPESPGLWSKYYVLPSRNGPVRRRTATPRTWKSTLGIACV